MREHLTEGWEKPLKISQKVLLQYPTTLMCVAKWLSSLFSTPPSHFFFVLFLVLTLKTECCMSFAEALLRYLNQSLNLLLYWLSENVIPSFSQSSVLGTVMLEGTVRLIQSEQVSYISHTVGLSFCFPYWLLSWIDFLRLMLNCNYYYFAN